jgi:methionyl-tRNA formyltransferase
VRLVFFGSGEFGVPTLEALHRTHDVALVISQPARPAGRKRHLKLTPVEAYARAHDLPTFTPDDPNDPEAIERLHAGHADAHIVIAYGHKLSPALLGETFALNLHASLLPKYRGAAPINHAMIAGDTVTGISVITLAQRMDAGAVLAAVPLTIDPLETAGELHDRLAQLGPAAVLSVLDAFARDDLRPVEQDHAAASAAPKFTKDDGTTTFDMDADRVRARIHGLTPWPGCTVMVRTSTGGHADDVALKLLRAQVVHVDHGDRGVHDVPDESMPAGGVEQGTILEDGTIACAAGHLELLSVQPAGGKAMTFEAFRNGHRIAAGAQLLPKAAHSTS